MEFIFRNPLYIPFVIANIWVIYKVIKAVIKDDKGEDHDDDDEGGVSLDDPDLDLPPGVTLPTNPVEVTA